jgi:hypothetical protein
MEQWEHLVAQPEFDDLLLLQQFLSDRGNEGWALVSATHQRLMDGNPLEGMTTFEQYTLFFKRPKS